MPPIPLHLAPWQSAPRWTLALSGGLDSTVLLHLLTTYARHHPSPSLRAVHIHHGLQTVADTWPAHCQRLCDALEVPLQIIHVNVAPGASLEQAARTARYEAFTQVLGPGEVLFTAQHRDDQAETLLFRLLRGAGLKGLAGMPAQRPLGQGTLVRPLLRTSRAALEAHAEAHGLAWIEDPSNTDERFARNALRHSVFPVLAQHWPNASVNLARSAEHLAEALEVLGELADADLAAAPGVPEGIDWGLDSLDLACLARLTPARQRNALRHWLSPRTRLPDTRHWAGWDALRDAAADAQPRWHLTDGLLLRSHGRVWWLGSSWQAFAGGEQPWPDPQQALALPANGEVRLTGTMPMGPLHIAYRQGGESLVSPQRGRRDLKRLLNEARVPSFLRHRLPLLFQGDTLLAVANLPQLSAPGVHLHWQPLAACKV